jgi:hypothetical protein
LDFGMLKLILKKAAVFFKEIGCLIILSSIV